MFEITTLEQLNNSKKSKEKQIQEIKNSYKIALSTGQSLLTKNILSLIKDKVFKLLEQRKTPEVLAKEIEKKNKLKEFDKLSKSYENEIEDILALLTSGLGQKKRVEKVTKTKINEVENVESKYIAYLENGIQYEIISDTHKELAKRYLDIVKNNNQLEKDKSDYLNTFHKDIKEICKNYVEFDFNELLQELGKISKNEYFSIYDFNINTYIDFYGNENDFKDYQKYIADIKEVLKELDKLNKEKQS